MRNVSDKVADTIQQSNNPTIQQSKYAFCVQFMFFENLAAQQIMGKHCTASQATDDANTAHALCTLDT
jgi:hypothetical protein